VDADFVAVGDAGRVSEWGIIMGSGRLRRPASLIVLGGTTMTPRKGYYKDYTGKKFGLWTVLSFYERTKNTTVWLCECECGAKRPVSRKYLQEGISESCGCSYIRKGWVKGYLGYIPLTNGLVAIVSAHRVEDLQRWNWHAVKKQSGWYACRNGIPGKDKERRIYMARYILGMDPSDKHEGDHRNRRTLDNRDRNLRPATHTIRVKRIKGCVEIATQGLRAYVVAGPRGLS
jgi:hypothetical protein